MSFPHGGAAQVWRDYETDGVPASGTHEVVKEEAPISGSIGKQNWNKRHSVQSTGALPKA